MVMGWMCKIVSSISQVWISVCVYFVSGCFSYFPECTFIEMKYWANILMQATRIYALVAHAVLLYRIFSDHTKQLKAYLSPLNILFLWGSVQCMHQSIRYTQIMQISSVRAYFNLSDTFLSYISVYCRYQSIRYTQIMQISSVRAYFSLSDTFLSYISVYCRYQSIRYTQIMQISSVRAYFNLSDTFLSYISVYCRYQSIRYTQIMQISSVRAYFNLPDTLLSYRSVYFSYQSIKCILLTETNLLHVSIYGLYSGHVYQFRAGIRIPSTTCMIWIPPSFFNKYDMHEFLHLFFQ